MLSTISLNVLKTAASQIGVREIRATNTGKEVNAYLASVGLSPGNAWCAAFIYWVVQNSGYAKNPLLKAGGVLDMWRNVPQKYRSKTPGVGFVGVMDFGSGFGHIFFIQKVIDGQTMQTIEGNTNNDGSRNGIGVFALSRLTTNSKIIGYINLPLYIADVNGINTKEPLLKTNNQKKK